MPTKSSTSLSEVRKPFATRRLSQKTEELFDHVYATGRVLLNKHGFKNWLFELEDLVTDGFCGNDAESFALVDGEKKPTLFLSLRMLEKSRYKIRQNILHAIAHLKAKDKSHGPNWQRQALKLGVSKRELGIAIREELLCTVWRRWEQGLASIRKIHRSVS